MRGGRGLVFGILWLRLWAAVNVEKNPIHTGVFGGRNQALKCGRLRSANIFKYFNLFKQPLTMTLYITRYMTNLTAAAHLNIYITQLMRGPISSRILNV